MKHSTFSWFIGFVFGLAATAAGAVNVTVQGTYDPWLAGMPLGSTASINDTAAGQSPLLVPSLGFGNGGYVTFSSVVGATSNTPGCCLSVEGGSMIAHLTGAENGIGNAIAPLGTLMGVFLDGSQPDLSSAPSTLDFSGSSSLDFTTLSPGLKQVFFIGDGLSAGSTTQQFYVPPGATRLFLGAMDGYEWNNNSGAFELAVSYTPEVSYVSPAPEPETYALMLAGLAMIGFAIRRHRSDVHID